MCEFVLKKQGANYLEKVCQRHSDLYQLDMKNPTRSIAANRLCSMLFHQMRNTIAAEQRNQKLEDIRLSDPHVKYTKKFEIEDTNICYALLKQMKKHNWNFPKSQELLKAILV